MELELTLSPEFPFGYYIITIILNMTGQQQKRLAMRNAHLRILFSLYICQ